MHRKKYKENYLTVRRRKNGLTFEEEKDMKKK